MTLTDTEITDARGFLCAAIENPFFDKPDPDHPINRWLRCVAENFPLWTFQTEEFLSWGEAELPSTYPLERIIDSVFRDEGLERDGFYHGPPEDIALLENVYARRMELGREERSLFLSCFSYETADGSRRMEKSDPPSLLSLTEPPRLMDWDDDGPIGSYSVYEEIGRELVGLIRAQDEAETTEDRSAAKAQLDAFLEELGAKLPAHRKSADPPGGVPEGIVHPGERPSLIIVGPPRRIAHLAAGQPNPLRCGCGHNDPLRLGASPRRSGPVMGGTTGREGPASTSGRMDQRHETAHSPPFGYLDAGTSPRLSSSADRQQDRSRVRLGLLQRGGEPRGRLRT